MPDQHFITQLLNHYCGGAVLSLMHLVGYKPAFAQAPIDDTFAMEIVAFLCLVAFFLFVRLTLSVEKPNPAQQIAELIHEFTGGQSEQIIGHDYERFQPFVTCVLLFILLNNCLGLIPGVITPTSRPIVPLGIAVLTFLYYNFHGVRVQGPIGYLKHFAGPLWWLAPLMFPVEVVSHLARMMSLTIRLYANMLASDLLILISFSIFPFLTPIVFLELHLGVSIVQAYVFMLLSMIYLGMAVAQDH
jgi:F-type H+-transporting ATPase subunit a